MALYDWSPDGRQLLIRSRAFVFASDVIEDWLVLYRIGRQNVIELSVADLLSRKLRRECDAILGRAGFNSTGELLVEAIPNESGSSPSCTSRAVWWRVNADEPSLSSVDKPVVLKTHGRFENAGAPEHNR
jgi:hypothetical protein